ncbi:NAD(P)/FAD-dependent oxidoreductase [Aspergillus ruber CBS 135680]|uniref:Putative fructosyl amino acid oxidase n=1 Tax=Aspergillus ruber (strain CBS 135680) TaxID=1388766 RepID=A0A017SBJ7_ASPRC|nr:putative fructosyl amino acid oxidase [Aspergillus ruber CBS 135680]EYE94322.1 putative fructosyl amino acid oxidase [Aspergillus ruber CBS 135680]
MTNDKNQKIIIVGAGIFGLGTALTLKQQGYQNVTVLDRALPPVPDGSSNDISRVIRFDYGDEVYARMAKEAYDLWLTPTFKEAFHQTPCLWVTQKESPGQPVQEMAEEYSRKTRDVLTKMGEPWHSVPSAEQAKREFPGFTGKLGSPGFDAFCNTSAGWADAGLATQRLAARCVNAGVSFITGPNGNVTDFEKRSDGTVKAVRTSGGNSIAGDMFIVATGAWSASLIPSWNTMIAAAQIVGYMRLTPEEMVRLKDLPIYFNLSTGFFCFPPHDGTGILKVACHGYGYTQSSENNISAPPNAPPSARANFIPEDGIKRLHAGMKDIFPDLEPRGFERVGLCWYNDTPSGDFIMDYHPDHKNLFIATGGSGHAFKFLPNIGKYIVGCFDKSLPQDLLEKWKFPTEYKNQSQDDTFKGDGSRGGPERRELTFQERDSFSTALKATSSRQSKI